MNRTYPAIFHKAQEGGYWVEFPDIKGCVTQGETLEETFAFAKEVLALALDGIDAPVATPVEKVIVDGDGIVMLVDAAVLDEIEYFKQSEVPMYIERGLKEKCFTKCQVAKILDVDRSYLTHIVKGARVPSVDMAKRIAILLGFDWKVFFAS